MNSLIEALRWPFAFAIICISGFFIFRRPIENLIARTRRVGKEGLETYEMQTPEKRVSIGAEEFLRSFDNRLLVEVESKIQRDLESRNVTASADRERILIRELAGTQIALHFEKLSNSIWGSQLELLRSINSYSDGVPIEDVSTLFEKAKSRYPDWYAKYPLESWIGFLQSFNVLGVKDSRAFITLGGREFLKFLVGAGKSDPNYG